jgi:uncharacterized protein
LGLDFYRKVAALQQKYANGKCVENDLQTNGLLLNEAWCDFLKEHGFLVGLSIDGPKHLHDRFRITRRGATASPPTATARRTASSRPPAASSPQLSLPRHQSVCRIETSKQGVRS